MTTTTRTMIAAMVMLFAGCSSPTAPTPIAMPPPVVSLLPTHPPAVPPSNPLLSDPRFNLAFYRQLALNAYDGPVQPLRRQTQAPRIYLRILDDAGVAIDQGTLSATASAIESTTGLLTGVFGIAGLERGTETREGVPGWITVRWSPLLDGACGRALAGGDLITLYPRGPCRCQGGPAVALLIVKHELGHALGLRHTDSTSDLMHGGGGPLACDRQPSEREIYHARIMYQQRIGSYDPM